MTIQVNNNVSAIDSRDPEQAIETIKQMFREILDTMASLERRITQLESS